MPNETKQRTCPKCGSSQVVPVRYGLPPVDAPPNDGTWVDGGCCIIGNSPTLACKACGARFLTYQEKRGSAAPRQ